VLARNHRVVLALVLLGTLSAAHSASAQLFVYTNQAAYLAAQNTIDTIEFDGLTTGANGDTSYANALNVGGVQFTTYGATELSVVGPTAQSGAYNFPGDGTPVLLSENDDEFSALYVNLPTNLPLGVNAVGTQIGDAFAANPITAYVTLSNGTTESFVYNAPDAGTSGLGYLGFVAQGVSITSIAYSDSPDDSGGFLTLDNFTYGTINSAGLGTPNTTLPTPEPGTLSLLGLGAISLFAYRRRLASR
jgi:PEP-CTERM motif